MKLSKNQLVDIKNIGKNLTIDEGLNNFTLFCYYLDQGAGQPPRSIQDFTTLMNEGAAGSTFHKISITPILKADIQVEMRMRS